MANELVEFGKNFEYCYFRAKFGGMKSPRAYLLHGVDAINGEALGTLVTIKLQDKGHNVPYNEFLAGAQVITPTLGYLNTTLDRPTCLWLYVTPERQYRKGLHCDYSTVEPVPIRSPSLRQHIIETYPPKGSDPYGGEHPVYLKAYAHQLAVDPTPRFYSIRYACAAVEAGEAHSLAVSRFFAVSLHSSYKLPVLWYKHQMEGIIYRNTAYVSEKILPFMDFFRKRWDFQVLPIGEATLT